MAESSSLNNANNDKREEAGGTTKPATLFDELGGEAKVKAIVETFMERVFADRMIGFFFRHADKNRIKAMEYELAAEFLGGPVRYGGRALAAAHAKHPIMGGHFARRRQILKETLDSYGVPERITQTWLAHTDSLRAQITAQSDSTCDPIPSPPQPK
jgi:hemoglobin